MVLYALVVAYYGVREIVSASRGDTIMTLRHVKFFTEKTDRPGVYLVSLSGDDRYFHRLEVHLDRPLGKQVLDYIEIYGIWFFLIFLEAAGMHRTARNLSLTVSRDSVRSHLLGKSTSAALGPYASALRAMFYGMELIGLEEGPEWLANVGDEGSLCSRWDGLPCPYQTVLNERFGMIGITYHAIDQYFQRTRSEGRKDQMLSKVQKLARSAAEEAEIPPEVQFKKILTYGFEQKNIKYLAAPRGWILVTAPDQEGGYLRVISVYQPKLG